MASAHGGLAHKHMKSMIASLAAQCRVYKVEFLNMTTHVQFQQQADCFGHCGGNEYSTACSCFLLQACWSMLYWMQAGLNIEQLSSTQLKVLETVASTASRQSGQSCPLSMA